MSAVFLWVGGLVITHIFLTALVYRSQWTDGQRHVDNILKMLLGVLSVAGLIALAIPQSNPTPVVDQIPVMQQLETPSRAPAPAPVSPPVDVSSTPDFQIGAPSIDGKPLNPDFGMPFGMSAQSETTNADETPSASAGYTPTSFTLPGSDPSARTDMSDEASSDQ